MSELTKFMDDLERIHTKIYESMRKFDAWCDTRQAAGLKTGDDDLSWQAWQAARSSMQEELTAARNAALAEGIRSGDLEHQLAELQALVKVKDEALRLIAYSYTTIFNCQVEAQQALSQTSGTEALDKLIAEAEQRQRERSAALFEGMYTDSSPGYRIDKEILKERK